MKRSVLSPFVTLGAVFGLMLAMFAGSAAVFGQATPGATPTTMNETIHPAHIHAGMCPEVGDVVFPLENVVMLGEGATETGMGTPAASPETMEPAAMTGTPTAPEIMGMGSTTIVEAPLDDILAAEHAINVHQSPENLALYIACGDITGEAQNGELVIDLEELNDSGVSGRATLTDNGDGTTTVVLELRHVGVDAMGTPDATPKP